MDGILDALKTALARRTDVALAVLFGSAATGRLRPTSDVDVAVRFHAGEGPEGWALGGLIAELEAATGRRVDLVDISRTRSNLLQLEISKGVLIKGDPEEYVRLKVRAFRNWRDFGPRFRRMAQAQANRLAREQGEKQ